MTDKSNKTEQSKASGELLLLSCPFCGQKPEHYHFDKANYPEKVMCANQGCPVRPMEYFESIADMIEGWNTRAV